MTGGPCSWSAGAVSASYGIAAGSERLGVQLRDGGDRWMAAGALRGAQRPLVNDPNAPLRMRYQPAPPSTLKA